MLVALIPCNWVVVSVAKSTVVMAATCVADKVLSWLVVSFVVWAVVSAAICAVESTLI